MHVPPRVLLVEDDPVIGEATKLHLERNDYDVTWFDDGLDAWHAFSAPDGPEFDLVLSDVMLPGIDGVTLCRRVREQTTTPFVLLSARTDSVDIVGGLEAGADDYVTKPFDVQVLLARLRSVVRRSEQVAAATAPRTGDPAGRADHADRADRADPSSAGSEESVARFGDLSLDRSSLEVRRGGHPVTLTPTEMKLLLELARRPGAVVSRRTLLANVWDYEEWVDDDHLVNVHVQRLRAKIGTERIETVRGFGYKLRA